MAQGVFPAGALTPAIGGLLSAAHVTEHKGGADERWADGPVSWDTIACPSDLILADLCSDPHHSVIASTSSHGNHTWPFGILAEHRCSTVGMSVQARRDAALAQLVAGTQKAVEHELWTGAIALASNRLDVPYLMDNTAVDITGAKALGVAHGVARLEQGLADIGLGVQGVIHLTREAALLALAARAVIREGDRLFTALGTPVAAGAGYDPGAVPAAPAKKPVPAPKPPSAPPATQYGFATGPVHVHLGEPRLTGESLNHTTNVLSVLADRVAAVFWDSCTVVAVRMDTTLAGTP